MSVFRSSHGRHSDLETSNSSDNDNEQSSSNPLDAIINSDFIKTQKRWMEHARLLNANRRFHYTLDLRKEEEKEQLLRKIRLHAQAIRSAYLFKQAPERINAAASAVPPAAPGEFPIGLEQLASISRDHNSDLLQQYGGVRGLADLLKTNSERGIHGDNADLIKRRNAYGSNNYPRKKGRSFLIFVWEACKDLTLIILMVAAMALISLEIKSEGIKEGWYDGGSIAFAVILVIVVTAFSDYMQALQFRDLNEEKRNLWIEVIRNGGRVEISIFDIVVGDVVPLDNGDQVPADGVLITGHSLGIDESSMTGESKIVCKDLNNPFLMSGCKVAHGTGTMLVTGVGVNTEWGLLMSIISEDPGKETPLQVRLNGVATFIGLVGLAVATAVLFVLLIRYFTGHTVNPDGNAQFKAGKTKVGDAIDGAIKIVTVAVTIVTVAVPQGLPVAVILILAYSMRKMMADKALVRRLSACETMGSATTICCDKTGALTLNQMAVVEAYIGGKKIVPPHNKSELSAVLCSLLVEGVAQNTNGSVYVPDPEDGNNVEVSGPPTEKAFLHWGMQLGMNFEEIRSESSIIHVFPFNSEKKCSGVALRTHDSKVHIHWKGAAEIVLECCTAYMDENDRIVEMDEKMDLFKNVIEDMASHSLNCLAIAYQSYEIENFPTSEEELGHWSSLERDLILLAIVGLKDPCRPGIKEEVQLCQNAGVKVRMITGDSVQTAKVIALECGILGSSADSTKPNIIEGKEFRALSDTQREEIAESILVMGQSSPNDKLLFVQALRKKGQVVAVTGVVTNDAPALHEADIGLALGIQGTEVAKENSDIIILDDNFVSIVKVIRWGRSVYSNIQKVIQFQLTINATALIINVVAAVSSSHLPLNAVQLLWVNLIMDTLGALALATEPPTDQIMDQPPVGRRERLMTNIMWRNLLFQAISQSIALLSLHFQGISLLGLKSDSKSHVILVKNTVIFNTFVFFQISNLFKTGKPNDHKIFKGLTRNYLFMGIVGITLLFQIVIIEFLGKFAKTVRLNWKQWIISIVVGSSGSLFLEALDILGLIGLLPRL